jgi:hypothetical protein
VIDGARWGITGSTNAATGAARAAPAAMMPINPSMSSKSRSPSLSVSPCSVGGTP